MPFDLAGAAILQVLPALDEGGVERGTIEIAQAVGGSGGRALVASAGGRLVPTLERAGGRHLGLKLLTKDPLNILLNARRLRRLIRAHRVALVHARSRAPAWSALLAARAERVPFVTTWHGVYGEDFPFKRHYNAVMARGDRVIAISRFVAERVARDYRVGPDRLRVIHRGADLAAFDPARIAGDRIARMLAAWRVPDGAKVVLLPGRITGWKGQSLLIEAMPKLARRDACAVFVGRTDGRAAATVRRLCAEAERAGVGARVRFVGSCADMPTAYALADVVVAPSLRPEPFGRTVVEAQAMERLVIVADAGGAAETVAHGETGWRIPPGDVGALIAAIDAGLALDPSVLAAFGIAARRSVASRFSTARMQAMTLAVYAELLGLEPFAEPHADPGSLEAAGPTPSPGAEADRCGSW